MIRGEGRVATVRSIKIIAGLSRWTKLDAALFCSTFHPKHGKDLAGEFERSRWMAVVVFSTLTGSSTVMYLKQRREGAELATHGLLVDQIR